MKFSNLVMLHWHSSSTRWSFTASEEEASPLPGPWFKRVPIHVLET
jgi:hypothetical protein